MKDVCAEPIGERCLRLIWDLEANIPIVGLTGRWPEAVNRAVISRLPAAQH